MDLDRFYQLISFITNSFYVYAQEGIFKRVRLREIRCILSWDIAAVTFASLVFKRNFILYS